MKQSVFACLIVSLFSACASIPNRPLYTTLELQGHRGARGLAPENTWPAFEAAIAHGMNVLELDTVLTADGDLIIHHDTATNPKNCRNDDGSELTPTPIRSLTVAELKKLDCGSKGNEKFPEQKKIPGTRLLTLDDFFQRIKELGKTNAAAQKMAFNIEAKFAADSRPGEDEMKLFATTLLAKIRAAGFESRVTLQSFEVRFLPFVKNINKDIKTSALFEPTRWQGLRMYAGLGAGPRDQILLAAVAVRADIISPYKLYVDAEFIRTAHERGIAVIPWTVNDKEEMLRLFRLGVDGIISDYPDRLKAAYEESRKGLVK